jgi:hypothetical protein
MTHPKTSVIHALALGAILMLCTGATWAAVSTEQAATLRTTLTPLGAERAGNAAGTIPAWSGAVTPMAAPAPGARRADPFASDKPLFTVSAQNLSQHADKLSDGQQSMFRKYPNYRIDVFPTRRSAVAPQWVYDNALRNATQARALQEGHAVEGAHGGAPFPIPGSGAEAMWNHLLKWQGQALHFFFNTYVVTADAKRVLVSNSEAWLQWPYYSRDGSRSGSSREVQLARLVTHGPPQKAGEALLMRDTTDPVNGRPSWQYLTGQRRVRKLPNATYDTPSFVASGVSNFDEIGVFSGPMDRYEWKIVGKKEMLIPYNNNRFYLPAKDDAVLQERFLNPDHVRWELHRVWIVEAKLAPGRRHVLPLRRFYLDEDTWQAVLADGWDAKGQLWKTFWQLNYLVGELPGLVPGAFGHYDVQTGQWIANNITNEKAQQSEFPASLPESLFSPDALAGASVR